MYAKTEFRFEQLAFPVTTRAGDTISKAKAQALLETFQDRMTVRIGKHSETPEPYVVESFEPDGEPWSWDYRGDSRYDLERAVLTWMIVNEMDDDLGHTLTITLAK